MAPRFWQADRQSPPRHAAARSAWTAPLLALCVGACAGNPAAKDNWAYTGTDALLKLPTTIAVGDLKPDVRLERYRQDFDAWQARSAAAVAAAKQRCAQDTGEPAAPSALSGYGKAFLACMNAQGWSRVGNPL